ncbi:MAG: sulfite exporter TauE/SafE family protein [Verrucomicrobiaceae bacterium]|nr:sulfite exporter TauE/SafE family protein [Verrucomicrobiaceae bacterium]
MLIIALSAFFAAGLTLLSGFGLGTLLMPVVALFFPVELAVSVTAAVHLANNLFKLALVGRHARRDVVLRFGIPAVLAAFAGAMTLGWLSHLPPVMEYTLMGRELAVMPVKLTVGLLLLGFVLMELSPSLAALEFSPRLLPVGGCVSGFFGGLSGNQGAFRSMFLLKTGLTKEQFIATGVVLAVIVDLARMPVYGMSFFRSGQEVDLGLVSVASIAAFAGSFLAARWLKKLTIRSLQLLVGTLLVVVAIGMVCGLL